MTHWYTNSIHDIPNKSELEKLFPTLYHVDSVVVSRLLFGLSGVYLYLLYPDINSTL